MEKKNLVKVSLATVALAVSLAHVAPQSSARAIAGSSYRIFDGDECCNSGGNCLPTVIITPKSFA